MQTLHEEIVEILIESGNEMSTQKIADRVNDRSVYNKENGSDVTAFQIHGRTRNYAKLFTRDGNMVGLIAWETHDDT